MFDSQTDVAAIVYGPGDDPDRLLGSFAADLRTAGNRVAGLLQCDSRGTRPPGALPMMVLPLGGYSYITHRRSDEQPESCSISEDQFSKIRRDLTKAIVIGTDVLIVNRFGKMETSGGGLLEEIRLAAMVEIPVLVAVPEKRFAVWNEFCQGMGIRLSCSRQQLDHWWSGVMKSPLRHAQKKSANFCEWAK